MINVTGLILTFNEAPNIERTLAQLTWLNDIVLVDSMSTDETVSIASRFPNVRVLTRAFTSHADQWNFGLQQTGIATEWVLALDADYVVPDALIREIQSLDPDAHTAGYQAAFEYCIDGRALRCGVYPPVTVLYRRVAGRYEQDGHTQRIRIDGAVKPLAARIHHDDRKSITHWLGAQARYMRLEAEKLSNTRADVGIADAVRRWIVVAPPAMFFYSYVIRGGVLDGRAGLFYALQRTVSELILSLFLVRRKLGGAGEPAK